MKCTSNAISYRARSHSNLTGATKTYSDDFSLDYTTTISNSTIANAITFTTVTTTITSSIADPRGDQFHVATQPLERETDNASSAQNLLSAPTQALPLTLSNNNDGSIQPQDAEDCVDTLREEALQSLRRARCIAAAELRMSRSQRKDTLEQSESSVKDGYR
ncbi:hypothetical protein TKK_0019554 [Trichogramma kaykai]